MRTISNSWNCSEIVYSEQLAKFCVDLKDYFEAINRNLPDDTMIQVDVIAGEKGEKDYVRFSLTSATDDYTSISMHAISEAIMKYHEEYFHRIPGTYNLACSTKARDGILSVKIVSSGGNKYLGSKDPQKSLKRSIMMRDVLSEVTTKSFILLASAVDTSYFAAKKTNEAEYDEDKGQDTEE